MVKCLHFKIYTYIALVGLLFFSISFWWFYLTEPQERSYYQDEVAVFPALTVIAIIYLIALRTLFYRPLLDHSEWVERNGIKENSPLLIQKNILEKAIQHFGVVGRGRLCNFATPMIVFLRGQANL